MKLVFDLEADGFHPTKVHCLSVADATSVRLFVGDEIKQGLALLDSATHVIGHNIIGYDLPVLKRLHGWVPKAKVEDTFVLACLMEPEVFPVKGEKHKHSLRAWGMRLKVHKGDYSGGWGEYNEDMGKYCKQDSVVARALWLRLEKERHSHDWELAIRIEYEFQAILTEQESNGWLFDWEAGLDTLWRWNGIRSLLEADILQHMPKLCEPLGAEYGKLYKKDGTLNARTQEWADAAGVKPAGPFTAIQWLDPNLNSRQQLVTILLSQGWKPTEFTETGQPSLTEESLDTVEGELGKAIAYRFMLSKRIALLHGLLKHVRADDRVGAGGIACGAVTGRVTHRVVVNVPRATSPLGPELRSLFIVPPGRKLVNADAEGLEMRMLCHYMNDPEFTKEVIDGDKEKGTDVHTKNVARFKLKGDDLRNRAKTTLYAMIYGSGDENLGQTMGVFGKGQELVWNERKKRNIDTKAERAGAAAKEGFLTGLPKYAILLESVAEEAGKGWVLGLDGRKLYVRGEHSALNTKLQAAGNIVVKAATIKSHKHIQKMRYDAKIVGHFHDEVNRDSAPECAEAVGKSFDLSLKWAEGFFKVRCPLAGSYAVGSNWSIH